MQVDFATPKKSMYMLIDTGSDVASITCQKWKGCHRAHSYPSIHKHVNKEIKALRRIVGKK